MQKKQAKTGLVWFRNDLRSQDNLVLSKAIQENDHVIGVFCFDPRLFKQTKYGFRKTEKYRARFLIESIKNLKRNLTSLKIELFVFVDFPEQNIPDLTLEHGISDIYLQKEWTFEEQTVLSKLKHAAPNNVTFHEIYDQFLFLPKDIELSFQNIPRVFTNFRKHAEKYCAVIPCIENKAAQKIEHLKNRTIIPALKDLGFEDFETHPNSAFPFSGGETEALQRLNHYFFKTKKLQFYKKTRNGLTGPDYSSKFSSWLANGAISARTIYWKVKTFESEFQKNQSTYWLIFELIWRDYFKYISLKHQNNIFKKGGILKKDYDWISNDKLLQQWINGETSSAFVNANMLELKKTGWMSNRGRQNVASYLTKDLKVDWRIGAAYFESLLIDYDVHSNYGNWMYVSGVGNDPRDRKFNVQLQAQRYDSRGKFQNLWLQETLFNN